MRFFILLFFSYIYVTITFICAQKDNLYIAEQTIYVKNNKFNEPYKLLSNKSIYPYRIIQIGNIVDKLGNLLKNKSFLKYVNRKYLEVYSNSVDKNEFIKRNKKAIKKLNKHSLSKFGSKKQKYTKDIVNKTIKDIKMYFENLGFLDVLCSAKIKINKKDVTVFYFIDIGERYKISDVRIICKNENLKKFINEGVIKKILKKNSYVSIDKIDKCIKKIFNNFDKNGFYYFDKDFIDVYIYRNKRIKKSDIMFKIEDNIKNCDKRLINKSIKISKIDDNGEEKGKKYDKHINEKVMNALNIKMNKFYSKKNDNHIYKFLYSTGVFSNINISNEVKGEYIYTNVLYSLNRKFNLYCSPNISFGNKDCYMSINTLSKIYNRFKILDTIEIRGDIEFVPVEYIDRCKIFKDPKFLVSCKLYYPFSYILRNLNKYFSTKIITDFEINFEYNMRKKEEYVQNLILVNFFVRYNFEITKNIIMKITFFPFEYILCKEYDEVSKIINPHSELFFSYSYKNFFRSSIECDLGLNKLINDICNIYFKVSLEQIFLLRISHSCAFNIHFEVGRIFSKKYKLPEYSYFRIGGSRTLRGWDENVVGPGDKYIYVHECDRKGNIFILSNIEFEYRFNETFSILCPFLDVGNIFNDKKHKNNTFNDFFSINDFYKKLHANIGFGLRITWKVFVIRLDIGFRVYDPTQKAEFGKRYFSLIPSVFFVFGLPFRVNI